MKKIILILLILLTILFSLIGINNVMTNKGIMVKAVNVQKFSEEILKDFEQLDSIENNHYHSEEEDINEKDEIMFKKNQDVEYVTNLFFAAAALNDVELFSSVFEFEQYNTDLFAYDNSDKYEVSLEMMKRITRDNTLENFKITSVKKHRLEPIFTINILLFYENENVKSIALELISKGTSHEYGDSIFFIKNSVWKIIKQIEEG